MKKIYVQQYPNGDISYTSALGGGITSSLDKPIITEIEAGDLVADDYFNNPNDYIVDIINETITKK